MNKSPDGRELWVGARVEASPHGSRFFHPGIIVEQKEPDRDAFGELSRGPGSTYVVKFDDGSIGA